MEQKDIYKQRILSSFPYEIKDEVEKVIDILDFNKDFLISPTEQIVNLDNETLKIPYRIYFDKVDSNIHNLNSTQKVILNCIFLRHYSGYIRQENLELLLNNNEKFIIPFSYQLLGEYVIEILFLLEKHIINNTELYLEFIKENKKYSCVTNERVISYWNEYYRRIKYNSFNDYIGKRILDKLNKIS